ncbi:MAG: insulinase family protein [Prevotella sp.]|nr:insulinase family protein [Prevotella sp.]
MKNRLLISLLIMTVGMTGFAQLPQDPDIIKGTLSNGMTYYVMHNAKETGLADFYIAQRVGSILEEPRQRGLAHFLEHMAFNGTKNFPGKDGRLGIVPWCETIGVKFGANLNAYTSVDQTVYHIGSAPVTRETVIDSCLLVLHDWSHYLLLEDEEIDKERGVIHEEWRTRRAGMALQRMMEDATKDIYKGSKYEDCLPIGSMDIVDHFLYKDLRDYYDKWYRPDLQAIIVVGDVDCNKIEEKIKAVFGPIPVKANAAERIYYPVADNDKMIITTMRDKEQPIVLAHLYMKHDVTPDSEKDNIAYLRKKHVESLVASMLNSRLTEIKQEADPPFMSATVRAGTFFVSRTKDAFSLSISCKQDNIGGGITAAVGAAERARRYGFTQSELNRAKDLQLSAAERQYNERNDRRNSWHVNRCVSHFLSNEPLISSEKKYELAKLFHDEVTLDEVNTAAKDLISDQNQVLVVYAPDKEEVVIPETRQLESIVLQAQQQEYSPYEDVDVADQLIDKDTLKDGAIVSEKPFRHGFTVLTLSNGMTVYIKPTKFQADEITMSIRADGGTSLYSDNDIPNFSLISSAVTEAGIAGFDAVTLRKMLTGKVVRVQPSVGMERQAVSGGCAKKDLETMLQLTHLYFTQPRTDTTAFRSLINRTRAFLTNRNASPKVDYNDSITAICYGHHPRLEPVTQATLDNVSYERILQIYKERFADASNFNAVFIGNIDIEQMKPLICKYLASLPASHKEEIANQNVLPRLVKEDNTHIFKKTMATPLANVTILYGADVEFTPENDLTLDFLKRVLQIAYTDSVREEKGGTYGVRVDFSLERDESPRATLRISYNADPDRYQELNPVIYQQLRYIAMHGPSEQSMRKIRAFLAKQYDQVAITNDYWSYIIWHEIDDQTDFDKDYKLLVERTTADDVQKMAQKLLDSHQRIEITMLSENPD